jgi:predicted Holliday junction resolvase-like endonuclease
MILEILTVVLVVGLLLSWRLQDRYVNKLKMKFAVDLAEARKDAVKRSRSTIEGQVFEQLVPHFPEWKHTPSDARFLGSPIDFVVFEGMSTGDPTKIVIVEIKKGKSYNTVLQNKIKKLVKAGKIEWETINLDKEEVWHDADQGSIYKGKDEGSKG